MILVRLLLCFLSMWRWCSQDGLQLSAAAKVRRSGAPHGQKWGHSREQRTGVAITPARLQIVAGNGRGLSLLLSSKVVGQSDSGGLVCPR